MKKTEHYQLNQWEKSDRILMEDFNADNAKIDAALDKKAELNDLTALQKEKNNDIAALNNSLNTLSGTLAQKSRIVYGIYTGSSKYGETNPTTLDFTDTLGKTPDLLFVIPLMESKSRPKYLLAARGMRYADTLPWEMTVYESHFVTMTWGDTSVSWYSTSNSEYQLNSNSYTYAYVAIG